MMDITSYNIRESRKKKEKVEINEIINLVNDKYKYCNKQTDNILDNIMQEQIIYNENFLKKDLEMIASYYNISKRKKTKGELIQDIVLFETDPTNFELTQKRKLMWFYLNELKTDRYLKKFIIFK